MANVLARRTLGNVQLLEVDAEPSAGAGTTAPVGSIASVTDGSGLYVKNGATDTDWVSSGSGVGVGDTDKVAVWTNSTTLSYDTNLHWNTTTNRLGINTSSPSADLHVVGEGIVEGQLSVTTNSDASKGISISNASSGTSADVLVSLTSDGTALSLFSYSTTKSGSYLGSLAADAVGIGTSAAAPPSAFSIGNAAAVPLHLVTGDQLRITVLGTGSVGVGNSSPTEVLDVSGKLRIRSDGTASLPALHFGSSLDVDTGIFHPAAEQISITTSGTERFLIDGSNGVMRDFGLPFFIHPTTILPLTSTWSTDRTFQTFSANRDNLMGGATYSTTNLFPSFTLSRARGTYASPTAVQSTDTLGEFAFEGYFSTAITNKFSPVKFKTVADGTWNSTYSMPQYWTITQATSTSVSPATPTLYQRMTSYSNSGIVINEEGRDFDFRIEGDTNPDLFFIDASVDQIAIGTSSPLSGRLLHLTSDTTLTAVTQSVFNATAFPSWNMLRGRGTYASATGVQSGDTLGEFIWSGVHSAGVANRQRGAEIVVVAAETWSGSGAGAAGSTMSFKAVPIGGFTTRELLTLGDNVVVNEAGVDVDFRVETDNNANTLFIEGSTDRIGVKTNSPGADLDVNGTAIARSTLQVDGVATLAGGAVFTSYITVNFTAVSTNTTLSTHHVVTVDASSAGVTITLPTAVGVAGRTYIVKKIDATANAMSVVTTSSQTIDGTASRVTTVQYTAYTLVSNGSNWIIV